MDLGEEGEEVRNLTTVLANTALKYNQNVEKTMGHFNKLSTQCKKMLGKYEKIKSIDDAFKFYRKCCKTDCYTIFSYFGFAPIHKFEDLKAVRVEINQIPSSTLNDPVEDLRNYYLNSMK